MDPLDVAIHAARAAGEALVAHYAQPHDIHVKGPRDILTEADLAAEAAALEVIRRCDPGGRIVSEESPHAPFDEDAIPTWYIDPLDGTTNYARGYPVFSVSVAMAQHGQVQCGAVLHPLLGHLFSAQRGQGAFLNGQRLQVSDRRHLSESLILLDWPRDQAMRQRSAHFLTRLVPLSDAVRSGGSAALSLCAIAAGWCDIYYQYTLSPWDVAAGLLMLEEAGGRATDLRGRPARLHQPDWLATNGLLHEAVLALNPWD